jgi:hypothetical protein
MWGVIPRPLSAARLDTTNSFHLQDNRNEAIGAGFVNVTKHDSYKKRFNKNTVSSPLWGDTVPCTLSKKQFQETLLKDCKN